MYLSLAHWQKAFIPRPCYGKIILPHELLNLLTKTYGVTMLLFKCNPFNRTFAQYYLFCRIFQKEIWTSLWVFLLATIMKERDKFGLNQLNWAQFIWWKKKQQKGMYRTCHLGKVELKLKTIIRTQTHIYSNTQFERRFF